MLFLTKTDWTSTDASSLRTFLESETGKKILFHLSESAPSLLDGGDQVEKTLVRSGQVKGFSDAINALIALTVEVPESVPNIKSSWPSLEDDDAFDPVTNLPK